MDPHIEDGLIRRAVDHSLRALSSDHMTIVTRHKYFLEASRQTRFFQRRYSWSGRGVENRPSVDPNADKVGHSSHRLLGDVIAEAGNTRILVVDLGRTLTAGETTEVDMSHRFVDTAGSFKPYLGHLAFDGCRQIRLTVDLPTDSAPAEAVTKHASSAVDQDRELLLGRPVILGRAHLMRYEWVVNSPQPGMAYQLQWAIDGR